MGTKAIRKGIACVAVVLVASIFCVGDVLAWNWGVHAYIDDNLGKSGPLRNLNEIYGGMAPDAFNLMFDHPDWFQYLYPQTHGFRLDGKEYDTFLKVWKVARFELGEAEAFGFVSHNDVWGADSTAHHHGRVVGKEKGYVIEKAEFLALGVNGLKAVVLRELGIDVDDQTAVDLCHNIVEAAVDILLVQRHPDIGKKLASSAILRSPEFPLLLVKAYAKDFAEQFNIPYSEAVQVILTSEKEFRKNMVLYGQALMQDQDTLIQLLAESLADQGFSYLGAILAASGGSLPSSLKPEDLVPLAKGYIAAAMGLCEGDYEQEIAATIDFVKEGLNSHHISY
jgi:hypothetical protein